MTKSLITLIDNSLLPAALLIVGKVIGLYITVELFNISWTINNIPSSFFSLRPLVFSEDIVLVSTYSDVFMYIIIMIGFSLVLIQALFFHNSHISPKTLTQLASNNLLSIVRGSFEIYHKGAVWAIYLWLANVLILMNVLMSKTQPWVFLVTLVVTIVLNMVLLNDAADEIELGKEEILKGKRVLSKIS